MAEILLLARDLTAAIPAAAWPDGVSCGPIEAADAPAIHALLQRAYATGFGTVVPDWLDWWEGLVADAEFARELAFVARCEGAVVGFCLCWTSSFVKDLVVAPGWQGRGLGTVLLATAMRELRARGAAELRLKVVAANSGALRLYRRMGFVGA